jgi:hypothetical protein
VIHQHTPSKPYPEKDGQEEQENQYAHTTTTEHFYAFFIHLPP